MSQADPIELSRYDVALGVLPLPLLAAAVGVAVTALPFSLLVGAATLVSAGIIADLLTVHAPTRE
ncbi:hypothetical protein [Haloarchaeobius iranensis]|uniref:Uncharacterized protein n=1 Tax=Haloarchaeobius iranensis TaxID=996166 RepID=A0A1G9WYI5_9EURY|nr:hypothetical protein [Haloarchaeobius iranensis]SDM89488.1 hypothetical protein SAMN05192554_10949 [Haloarchaeobius iranensis]